MNNQGKLLNRLFLIILCFISLSILEARKNKKENCTTKFQGLLTQNSDQNQGSYALETLSSLPSKDTQAEIIKHLDSLDVQKPSAPQLQSNSVKVAQSTPANNPGIMQKQPTNIDTKDQEIKNNNIRESTSDKQEMTENVAKPTERQIQETSEPILPFTDDQIPSIEFHFENTDLQNLVSQVSEIYQVTFISDDAISPLPQGAKSLKGNKISFKTQKPLTKKEAWNLFITFLDLAGFAVVPQADPKVFKIMLTDAALRSAIPTFIGIDSNLLPDSDQLIRYIYFVENTTIDAIKGILESLKSPTAPLIILQESKAFLLTDKSYNIKTLMHIIKELDKVTMPQALSVLKLRRTDAKQVKDLYDSVAGKEESITARLFPTRKPPTSLYFPENTRIIAEPRTNTLILLGPKDAIAKIEDFITKYIDIDIDKPYSPLNVYTLLYADADTVAKIMTDVTQFGRSTPAGISGGVRGEDKYLRPMSFIPEKETNRVIIRGDYEDYLRAIEIIKKLDEPQPQVAMEVLILSLDVMDTKQLGTALRSATPGIDGLVGPNVKYQTSGLAPNGAPLGIVENPNGPGVQRLLGNLLNLVNPAQAGNTIITLGMDQFGVWGIFQALQTITNTQVIANPFLTATNKSQAIISVGETRRVVVGTVISAGTSENALDNDAANLEVTITPQINSDGFILLQIKVTLDNFTDITNQSSGTKNTKSVETKSIVADREVLAIGGLIQNTITEFTSKVPVLGDIPIIGWLFKNKQKIATKSNLLILISTRIIPPAALGIKDEATQAHIKQYKEILGDMVCSAEMRDPVFRSFFAEKERSTEKIVEDFIFKRQDKDIGPISNYPDREARRANRRKEAKKAKRATLEQQKNQQVKGKIT